MSSCEYAHERPTLTGVVTRFVARARYLGGMWLFALPAFASADDLRAALDRCSGALHPLPALSAEQRGALAAGEVVRIVHHGDPEAPSTAVGIALLDGGRDGLWIAAQDPHTQVDPSLVEFVVEDLGADHAVWYGHLDLPWPIKDRQWVVESRNTHRLATSTADGCWEHTWKLVPDGLSRVRPFVERGTARGITTEALDEAVYTPVNEGSWLMAPLPDGRVLVSYQATSVVGGAIPDSLVLQLTMSRLESVLRSLEERAKTWSPTHYTAEHAGVPGGAGAPIARFP